MITRITMQLQLSLLCIYPPTNFRLLHRAGCSSNVGMICWPGGQHLNLAKGCWGKGVVIHEIGEKKINFQKRWKLICWYKWDDLVDYHISDQCGNVIMIIPIWNKVVWSIYVVARREVQWLNSGSSGQGSSPGRDHCGQILHSHSASLNGYWRINGGE